MSNKSIFKYFKKSKDNQDSNGPVIGNPTNVNHDIHVSKNAVTGQLEGLPSSWKKQIYHQITEDEKNRNPEAVMDAVKFYNYSMKKKDNEPFKLITKQAIEEETENIEKFMISKDAHKSKDSDCDLSDHNFGEKFDTVVAYDSVNRYDLN